MHLKPLLSFSLYIPYWCVSQRMLVQIIVGLDRFFCCVWIRKAAELFWVQSQTKSDFCLFQTISAPDRTDECCWIFSKQTPSCRSTEHIFSVINASVISVLCHRRLWSVQSLWTSTCPVPSLVIASGFPHHQHRRDAPSARSQINRESFGLGCFPCSSLIYCGSGANPGEHKSGLAKVRNDELAVMAPLLHF